MKNVKRSLLTSSVSLLLCFVMLIGTTFAWFTDVATSANNIIKTGKLDVSMHWNTDNGTVWTDAEGINAEPIFDYHNWEPGYTEVRYIKIGNAGNLAFQYRMYIDPTGVVGELADVIDVYYDVVTDNNGFAVPVSFSNMGSLQRLGTLRNVISEDIAIPGGVLLPAGETENGCYSGEVVICVAFHMQESANNHYQGESIGDSFGITLHATQYSYEKDSFGTEYDSDAKWPERPINLYATKNINGTPLLYGELTSEVAINGDKISATLPEGVKIADNATTLNLTVESTETDANLYLGEDASARGFDVHITGIAADNTQPMIVNLGAVLPAGIAATELKLYHTENGTPVQMTRVASTAEFARHNQYVYNEATGEVTIYVASFSTFSMVKAAAVVWNGTSDYSWYNTTDTSFTLNSAEAFAGFRDIVDGGYYDAEGKWVEVDQDSFDGKTVTLGTDIDLNKKLFNPIGGGWAYNGGKTFNGTFDGGNHTIYNIYVNGWELDATGDKHSSTSMGAGLFSSIHNATIENLVIYGADMRVETTSIGVVVGCAQGTCTFNNIVVTNATLGNYQMRNGGIVGDIYVIESDNVTAEYSHTFTNIVVDSSVKLVSMWGDFDTGNGGVIGGKYGSAKVLMQNVIVACELDVFSDVTAAYQWYAYRRCGMLVGYTGQNSPKQSTNASADFLTCKNVNVYYGDWVNYTYYQFNNQTDADGNRLWYSNYPWVRAQKSVYNGEFSNVRYGNPIIKGEKINTNELAEANKTGYAAITFNQLYGGGQGVYGTAEHEKGGVTTNSKESKTIYIHNNLGWTNLKLQYWFANGDDTWTTIIDGIDMSTMLVEENVYKIQLPTSVSAFKIVADDSEVETIYLSTMKNDHYCLGNSHDYNYSTEYTNYFQSNGTETVSCSRCSHSIERTIAKSLIYLTPNSDWKKDSARFAAYFFGNGEKWVSMTDFDGDGIFECEVPSGYPNVIFCRMNPSTTANNWNNKWNQTSDLTVPTDESNNHYTVKDGTWDKGGGTWGKLEYKTIELDLNGIWNTDDAKFAVYTWHESYSTWIDMTDADGDGKYEANIRPGYKFIICRMKTGVPNDWGQNDENVLAKTIDMSINKNTNSYMLTKDNTLSKIYLKANNNWKADGARFAAYVWTDSGNSKQEEWYNMNSIDSTHYYSWISNKYENIIFCRMNPGTTENNWNNKWNQTSDLKIPTDGKNLFTLPTNIGNGGTWSNK